MGRPSLRRREIDIRLRTELTGQPRKLVPWWVRALKQVRIAGSMRRQARGSLGRAQVWRDDGGGELRAYARRSVVKASYSRNRKSGAWSGHAKYLARRGAQHELTKGTGFDGNRGGIDLIATVRGWEQGDELLWRFIVSPEDADRLNLRDHVRELTSQMEHDLGTKLEWVAIDHHNTDDAHVHLLVRGVRDDGHKLEIDRDYLRAGIRTRSQEIATRESRTATRARDAAGARARGATRAVDRDRPRSPAQSQRRARRQLRQLPAPHRRGAHPGRAGDRPAAISERSRPRAAHRRTELAARGEPRARPARPPARERHYQVAGSRALARTRSGT